MIDYLEALFYDLGRFMCAAAALLCAYATVYGSATGEWKAVCMWLPCMPMFAAMAWFFHKKFKSTRYA